MYISNNAINHPALQNPGDLLIGTGTIPIAGPLVGTNGIDITPLGTAIRISNSGGAGLTNFVQTFAWGTTNANGFDIPCHGTTYFASVIVGFDGDVSEVWTYWISVGSGKEFTISIWDQSGQFVARTDLFTPVLGLNKKPLISSGMLNSARLYWFELRPWVTTGLTCSVYGQKGNATDRLDFNRSDFSGGTAISPNGITDPTSNRPWFYLF